MHRVILSLGSNLQQSAGEESVIKALAMLTTISTSMVICSGIYLTRPHSGIGSDYTNAVVSITATLAVSELEELLKRYEAAEGRTPEARAAGRVPIDVDVVVYDGEIIRRRDYCRPFFRRGFRQLYCLGSMP